MSSLCVLRSFSVLIAWLSFVWAAIWRCSGCCWLLFTRIMETRRRCAETNSWNWRQFRGSTFFYVVVVAGVECECVFEFVLCGWLHSVFLMSGSLFFIFLYEWVATTIVLMRWRKDIKNKFKCVFLHRDNVIVLQSVCVYVCLYVCMWNIIMFVNVNGLSWSLQLKCDCL